MVGILTRLLRGSVERAKQEHSVEHAVRLPDSLAKLNPERRRHFEEMVALGVLFRYVAHADGHFSPEEEEGIRGLLSAKGLSQQDIGLVIAAARESAEKRCDIQGFTRDFNKKPYEDRVHVVGLLFQIACADSHLSGAELEAVRKVAKLLWVSHADFIDAKLRVKAGSVKN